MKTIFSRTSLTLMACVCLLFFACESDPDGPVLPDNLISLNYDDDNVDAPSLPANAYEAGVRFPASQMSTYTGERLMEVNYYVEEIPSTCVLRIYTKSDSNTPDSLVYSANVRGELRGGQWNNHVLSTPYELTGEDLWITIAFSHTGQQRTIGCDLGPAATNGDWLLDAADDLWIPLNQRAAININWNIRGAIERN